MTAITTKIISISKMFHVEQKMTMTKKLLLREELHVDGFNPVFKGIPPFTKFSNGFGYIGVLLEHTETGKLQCHLCGRLALSLSKHLYHKHKNISPTEYRKMTGLNLTTPLLAISSRRKIKNNFLDLTEEKRRRVVKRLLQNTRNVHAKHSFKGRKREYIASELRNKFGTCPEQAKTLFWEEYGALGRIPTNSEMSGKLRSIVYTRFSSYKDALIAWGISESEYRDHIINGQQRAVDVRAENDFFPKYSDEEVKEVYGNFFFQNNRLPTWGEVVELGLPGRAPFQRVFGKKKSDVQRDLKIMARSY